MARQEYGVLVFRREHFPCVEAHAETGRVRTGQHDRWFELLARASPAEFRIGEIALVAKRRAEMLAYLGDSVELVLRHILRPPIAGIVGEIELLVHRIPIESNRMTYASRDHFRAAAVEIDAADLAVRITVQHIVSRLAYLKVELLVRSDSNEFPAVRFVLRQIFVDHRRFRRIVEHV